MSHVTVIIFKHRYGSPGLPFPRLPLARLEALDDFYISLPPTPPIYHPTLIHQNRTQPYQHVLIALRPSMRSGAEEGTLVHDSEGFLFTGVGGYAWHLQAPFSESLSYAGNKLFATASY
jgi:hypothetical protein